MIFFFWHSLVWIPTTPTCDGVYQIWYGFVVLSIIKEAGWMINRKYCDEVKVLWGNTISLHLRCHVILIDNVIVINVILLYLRRRRQVIRSEILCTSISYELENKTMIIEIIFLLLLLPCCGSFWSVLSCQDSLLYPSAPVQALWRLSLKQNDKDLLLLVP